MSTSTEIAGALSRAVAFLESVQQASGELPVFAARPGHRALDPSIFPTALAVYSLSFAPEAERIRERAAGFLASEMSSRGLWKHWPRSHPHHRQLPPDLDDTACASDALRRSGRTFPDNRALLLANRNREGLFRTWKLGAAELRHPLGLIAFFRATSAKPFDVDAVVNANVLHYLGASAATEPVVAHLVEVLRREGEGSCDKWYENPFVVWYFFSRALRGSSREAGEMIAGKLAKRSPESALEHALAACILQDWGFAAESGPLLALQLESGAWAEAPVYHGGRRRTGPRSFAPPHPDTPHWGSEAMTTAFAVEALSRMMSRA